MTSHPHDLIEVLKDPARHLARIGLEAGPLSQWLFEGPARAEDAPDLDETERGTLARTIYSPVPRGTQGRLLSCTGYRRSVAKNTEDFGDRAAGQIMAIGRKLAGWQFVVVLVLSAGEPICLSSIVFKWTIPNFSLLLSNILGLALPRKSLPSMAHMIVWCNPGNNRKRLFI